MPKMARNSLQIGSSALWIGLSALNSPIAAFPEKEADEYLVHLLEKWRTPLAEVPIDKFEHGTYTSRWGTDYCIDAMLEHAVMHPIRHEFQLKTLMGK